MRRFLKKSLPVILVALLLLPFLLLCACAQEYDHDLCEPPDATVQSFLTCQHIFMTTITNEYRYVSETEHDCYEVEIRACVKCPVTEKKDLFFLYTEHHTLEEIDYYEIDESGEYIYYGTCEHCNGYGKTTP